MANRLKVTGLCENLKKLLSSIPDGGKLPTVRELMKTYSVSQVTVVRALSSLKEENLITSCVGDGTYKARPTESGTANSAVKTYDVGLFVHDNFTLFAKNTQEELLVRFREAGLSCILHKYRWEDSLNTLKFPPDIRCAVILPDKKTLSSAELFYLKQSSIPVIIAGLLLKGTDIDSVASDDELGGSIAAAHLISQGHRKLAVLMPEPSIQTANDRIDGFCKYAKLSGLPEPIVYTCADFIYDDPLKRGYECVKFLCKQAEIPFTALFVVNDANAISALKAFHDSDIKVPEQISLIGYDDIPESSYSIPALTTVKQDLRQWSSAIISTIRKRLSGICNPSVQRSIPPSLIVRDSTSPL